MTIVDSSVWINYFNGDISAKTDRLDRLLMDGKAQLLDIILAEVLQGFNHEHDFNTALHLMETVPCYSSTSKALAIQSARYYRHLRKHGITIRKTIDMFIATWCIEQQALLLENDRDFRHIASVLPLQIIKFS